MRLTSSLAAIEWSCTRSPRPAMSRLEREKRTRHFVNQCRALPVSAWNWLTACWPSSPPPVPDYTESPEYKKAVTYYQQFQQKDDVDYAEVLVYARELAER